MGEWRLWPDASVYLHLMTDTAWDAGIIADNKTVQTEQVCSIFTSYVSINETNLPAKWRDVNNQANWDNFGTNKKVEIKLEVKRWVVVEGKQNKAKWFSK